MKTNPAKKRKARGIVAKKSSDNEENAVDGRQQRRQIKQMKRVRFLAKLEDGGGRINLSANKPVLKKKKRRQTRRKAAVALASLSSLADDLPSREEAIQSAQAFQKKGLRNEPRQKIVMKETQQLAAVLAHPEFQKNPLLAIQRHLTNTVVVDEPTTRTQGQAKKPKGAKPTKKGASAELMEE